MVTIAGRRAAGSKKRAPGKKAGSKGKNKQSQPKPRRSPRGRPKDDREEEDYVEDSSVHDSDVEASETEPETEVLTKQHLPTKAAKKLKEQGLEILALRNALAKAHAGKGPVMVKKAKKSMTDEEKVWFSHVSTANKKYNWGKVKFCNSDTKLIALTGNIFDKWNLKDFQGLGEQELQDAKVRWVTQNKDLVRISMNEVRNYAQSRIRDWVVERLVAKKPVPMPVQVMECAMRKIEYHTDPEKQKIFDLYHDELLFKVLGREHWDWWVRHYNPISGLKDDGSNLVEYGSEAFLVALFENCWEKWQTIALNKAAGKVDKKRKDDVYKTPFIDKDAGVAKWGGWNKKGRDRVKDISKLVKDARAQDHVQQLEDACLQRLRIKHDIVARDAKKGAKKKRKRPVAMEVESDDEFDCL